MRYYLFSSRLDFRCWHAPSVQDRDKERSVARLPGEPNDHAYLSLYYRNRFDGKEHRDNSNDTRYPHCARRTRTLFLQSTEGHWGATARSIHAAAVWIE